jgi:hypothetical protein
VTDQSSLCRFPSEKITPLPPLQPPETGQASGQGPRVPVEWVVCIRCGRKGVGRGDEGKASPMTDRQSYIRTILNMYAQTPGVAVSAHGSDRTLAGCFFDRQIPIAVVESALLLGSARRMYSGSGVGVLHPIRSLHYFAPIVDEVLQQPLPPNYVRYLRLKLRSTSAQDR